MKVIFATLKDNILLLGANNKTLRSAAKVVFYKKCSTFGNTKMINLYLII